MVNNYSFIFSISYVHVPLPFRFVFDDVVLPFVRAVIKGQAKRAYRNVMAVEREILQFLLLPFLLND